MASAQSKRQKLAANTAIATTNTETSSPATEYKETSLVLLTEPDDNLTTNLQSNNKAKQNSFGLGDVDDLSDNTDEDESGALGVGDDDDDDDDDDDEGRYQEQQVGGHMQNHVDIQEQLAAAGPAGVAAAAAIATARKRKRPHSFETNPSVRKRQQTRLIRKLRACIDEYTMRVGQQAVVLITMPGKTQHNFKVFGAQPLESVIRACKMEIMGELEQALLEQAPKVFKEDNANKHELPPLVIDGIPTPVEKMTQAQLRAFIPLMLKYSTGRGKPGWGKDTTRPPWWPETLPWANVRSDARDEDEKQRISWTTTLRQIVTNCYKFHGRDDLLPTFDENEESLKQQQEQQEQLHEAQERQLVRNPAGSGFISKAMQRRMHIRSMTSGQIKQHQDLQSQQSQLMNTSSQADTQVVYSTAPAYATNFVHTITNSDGTVSLIQVDPANAQILTLPDGTQVRAVRLQTLGSETLCGQQIGELHEASSLDISNALTGGDRQQQQQQQQTQQQQQLAGSQTMTLSEASVGPDGQIIVTGEDGTQSCYPMSSLVSIPASVYQQFAQGGGQQLSIMTADGTSIPASAVSLHAIQDPQELAELQQQEQQQQQHQQQQQQQVVSLVEQPQLQTSDQSLILQSQDNKSGIVSDCAASKTTQADQQQQQQ